MQNHNLVKKSLSLKDPFRSSVDHDVASRSYLLIYMTAMMMTMTVIPADKNTASCQQK